MPTYNPTVVYGAWPYPAYPPYAYYPPGYTAATSLFSFGVGIAVGSALWGDCDWGNRDVDINVNRYNSFNKTNITNATWDHSVEHRKGVQYRDAASQQKYNRATRTGGDSREAFRGRAESGRQQLARGSTQGGQRQLQRGSAEGRQGQGTERARDRQSAQEHQERATRERPDAGRTAGRQIGQEHRQVSTPRPATDRRRQAAAFEDIGKGREVRHDSERGKASRQSAAASRASFQGGGGGRGGGHEARGNHRSLPGLRGRPA